MKKTRRDCNIAAIRKGFLARQKNAKKNLGWRSVIPVCAVAVMFGRSFPVMAITLEEQATKCEEALAAGGCVAMIVPSYLAVDYSSTPPPPGAGFLDTRFPVGGNDHTCTRPTSSAQRSTWAFGEKYYSVSWAKYYYDPVGKRWVPYGGGGTYWATEDQLNQWKSAADYAPTLHVGPSPVYTSPSVLYPNGCSDLPSQQSNQIPNSDTGRPECNNQVL